MLAMLTYGQQYFVPSFKMTKAFTVKSYAEEHQLGGPRLAMLLPVNLGRAANFFMQKSDRTIDDIFDVTLWRNRIRCHGNTMATIMQSDFFLL